MPAPQSTLNLRFGVEALRRQDAARKAREDRMRNALEVLAGFDPFDNGTPRQIGIFVRATAREGLGHE